jgi:hypothetical protein
MARPYDNANHYPYPYSDEDFEMDSDSDMNQSPAIEAPGTLTNRWDTVTIEYRGGPMVDLHRDDYC